MVFRDESEGLAFQIRIASALLVGLGQGGGGVAADVSQQFAELPCIVRFVREVAILSGINVQGPVGTLDSQHRNDTVALI